MQNCGQEILPAALSAASRLRQLRITDVRYRPMYFEMDDLDTLSSMSSLTFLSFTQASLGCDKCVDGWRSAIMMLLVPGSAGVYEQDVGLIACIDRKKQCGALGLRSARTAVQPPDALRATEDPEGLSLTKPFWCTYSLQNLCYILWELRVRSADMSSFLLDAYGEFTTGKGLNAHAAHIRGRHHLKSCLLPCCCAGSQPDSRTV